MNLDEAQSKKVTEWIEQGLKLSEIQSRLGSELGLRMTYMEVRMLVDDLKLVPKDPEPTKPASSLVGTAAPATSGAPQPAGEEQAEEAAPAATGGVSVTVDQIALPGAVVSGKVTFSDGKKVGWLLDQSGRLGLTEKGYRPPTADLQQFQAALDQELSKMGF